MVASSAPPRLAEIRPLERADLQETAACSELGLAKMVQAAEPRLILATPDAAPVIDQLVASGVLRWG